MSETYASRPARIAHVLFLDLVGFSRQSITGQGRLLERLNAAVAAAPAFRSALETGSVLALPTGDGAALVFDEEVTAPAQCAVELARSLGTAEPLALRMGIHSGLVQARLDVAGRENVVGEGINTAQGVMDFGDAGHILLSAQYALWLQQVDDWWPRVHPVGEGTAKHDLRLQIYSLHGEDFGREDPPVRLSRAGRAAPQAPPAIALVGKQVALLYRPTLPQDQDVMRAIEEQLRGMGCEVFVDHERRINARWARAIEEPIRAADAVVAIVSPESLQSEMLEFEMGIAHDQHTRTGKPSLLPVWIGPEGPVDGLVGELIRSLHHFVWRGPEDSPKLAAELVSAIAEPLLPRDAQVRLEPVGGAVPPDSPFYVRRDVDAEFLQALDAGESILLVKGARQIGKTSLLAQGARRARELGWRCVLTDFQKLNAAQIASEERFYRLLAATMARQLRFDYDWEAGWDDIFGANLNMEAFLRDLIAAGDGQLVWFMDEADKLFTAPFACDFFGLVRSWHNSRSTEPEGPWDRMTVVIAYATEAHLFIRDLNQSPFNVGRRLELEDFSQQQAVDLNARYGGPLRSLSEVEALQGLVEGQPFLTRRALDALATGKSDLAGLMAEADLDTGPFADHLQRILVAVTRLPEVTEYVRGVLRGAAGSSQDAYYRLRSAGIIKQQRDGGVRFRCELYRRYLQRHLQ